MAAPVDGVGMIGPVPSDPDALAQLATNRPHSLFAADFAACTARISEAVHGRRILVVGGAGSIGSAAIRALLPFGPMSVHVIDQDENALAELVRDLRNGDALGATDLRALPIDYGAPVMCRLLDDEPPYHLVLNFAALKHVRSEKDVHSLTQLLDTNVVRQARLLEWLARRGAATRYFSVSTDKAANPVNLMGASKRLMEHVVFSGIRPLPGGSVVTSARFANVAFSAGSLPESFLHRIAKRQPLAVPEGARRYFVSLAEAGQICLIAATAVPDHHIAFPRLSAAHDERQLAEIAIAVVEQSGWVPVLVDDEGAARAAMASLSVTGRYPILLTPLDTVGEKPFEEFVSGDEREVDIGFARLGAVRYSGGSETELRHCLSALEALVAGDRRAGRAEVVDWVRGAVNTFDHTDTGRHLDQRM